MSVMRRAVDFGARWSHVYDRLAGFELRQEEAKKGRAAWTFGSKERKEFSGICPAAHRQRRKSKGRGQGGFSRNDASGD